jgi:hypothetical protein
VAAPLKQAEVSIELVDDWEDLEFINFSIPDKVTIGSDDEDMADMSDLIALAQYRKKIIEREDAWYYAHAKEHVAVRKLPKITWKTINRFKGKVSAIGIVEMIYSRGMTNRWTKRYKKNFPTWHAVGAKWQGQINKFVDDFVRQLKFEQRKVAGDYDGDFWSDGILTAGGKILPTILKRHHNHTAVVLESMIADSRKLDWGREGLHAGLQ